MFDLPKYGDGICLARLSALLASLGIDRAQLAQRAIAVTGSNGKGSTAAFLAGIGRAFGLRTGLFTSPHLYRINERFRLDGDDIDEATLAELGSQVSAAIAAMPHEKFGAFEAQFALACVYFQHADCALMVFEAGIGGRFDPVRLLGARTTCVTSVDFEHVDLLGNTLEAIAFDKSDACASGGTIVYGENCRALKPHLAAYNLNRRIDMVFVRDDIGIANEHAQHFDLHFGDSTQGDLAIALPGAFQINNAAIAAALFTLWLARTHPETSRPAIGFAIRKGLKDTHWPGRLETIARDPLTVIDVGHTPDGVTQALNGLFATHGCDGWILVLGTSRDKDVAAIAGRLAPSFDRIICTSAQHKGADAQTVATATRLANPNAAIDVAATVAEAVTLSRGEAACGRRIYVAGGLFAAIEYAHVLRGGDAADLAFF